MPVNPRKEAKEVLKEKEEICGFCKVPLAEIKVNNGSKRLLVCNNINCPKFRQPQGVRKIYFGRETNVKEAKDVRLEE